MRKILFARERVGLGASASSSSSETAMFIALLVFFALIAAGWVLRQGLLDERRNVFRLVCVQRFIIFSLYSIISEYLNRRYYIACWW